MGSAECPGRRLVVERGADRASAPVWELQREVDVFFPEQVRRRHPRHLRDGQSQTVGTEREGMGLRPTRRTPSASWRCSRLVPVLRPERQTT